MLSQSCHAELVEASSKANAGGKILRFAQDDKKERWMTKRALSALLWVQNSPLPSPTFRLGADNFADCPSRGKRQRRNALV